MLAGTEGVKSEIIEEMMHLTVLGCRYRESQRKIRGCDLRLRNPQDLAALTDSKEQFNIPISVKTPSVGSYHNFGWAHKVTNMGDLLVPADAA